MSFKHTLSIGLMLFALFFGAGNMIFPPLLGQAAGTNIWPAVLGFLMTGVGLPLLGITAIAISGGDLEKLASRVHPIFAIVFTIVLYLSIGPIFAIPRTGTVAFEIGVVPLLPNEMASSSMILFIYTIIFFGITLFLSLNPSKLVDSIGKILTPALLITIAVLVVQAFINPMGPLSTPGDAYGSAPFFKGFIEGYLTLDALAALVFGIVVINAVKEVGVTDRKKIASATIKAGVIAALGLMLVYISLAYLGATSPSVVGTVDNGGQILSKSAAYYYGAAGKIVLGLAITLACLTTSVGLVTSCSEYFHKIWPKFNYRQYVVILSVVSMLIANVGLTQLINLSLPVLLVIYPIAITLVFLAFLNNFFKGSRYVYTGGVIGTALVSIWDGLVYSGIAGENVKQILSDLLPLYNEGVGWIVPALIGIAIGYLFSFKEKKQQKIQKYKKVS